MAYKFAALVKHKRTVSETVGVIVHIATLVEEGPILSTVYEVIPLIDVRFVIRLQLYQFAEVLFVVADIVFGIEVV